MKSTCLNSSLKCVSGPCQGRWAALDHRAAQATPAYRAARVALDHRAALAILDHKVQLKIPILDVQIWSHCHLVAPDASFAGVLSPMHPCIIEMRVPTALFSVCWQGTQAQLVAAHSYALTSFCFAVCLVQASYRVAIMRDSVLLV